MEDFIGNSTFEGDGPRVDPGAFEPAVRGGRPGSGTLSAAALSQGPGPSLSTGPSYPVSASRDVRGSSTASRCILAVSLVFPGACELWPSSRLRWP